MTNFKNKKLSQIEEEEEAVSNLDEARKSHLAAREREMQTGINNNLKLASQFKTALARSRKKTAVPLLKSGFKTAYQGNLERFLTNGDADLMRNLNTMQVNGKNFHMFQTAQKGNVPFLPALGRGLNEDHTAEDGILQHIREESLQRQTIQSGQSKFGSNMRSSRKPRDKGSHRFYTGNGLGLAFGKRTEQRVFTLNEPGQERRFRQFYTKEPQANFTFNDEEPKSRQEPQQSASISVTNNDITNNNQSVSINNKMNTYIIIVNDKKQERFLSEKLAQPLSVLEVPKAKTDPRDEQEAELDLGPLVVEKEKMAARQVKPKSQKVDSVQLPVEEQKSTEANLETENVEEIPSQLKPQQPIQHVVLNGVGR